VFQTPHARTIIFSPKVLAGNGVCLRALGHKPNICWHDHTSHNLAASHSSSLRESPKTASKMKLSVVLLALLSGITGQVIDPPVDVWTATIGPTSIGNECKLSPGDSLLFCTSNEGSIWAFFPGAPNGSTWRDPSASGTLTSSSGVTFTSSATNGPYVIFASTEDSTSWYVNSVHAEMTYLGTSPM
jgi:hypothetical protein